MKALAAALVAAVALTCVTAQAANRIDTEGFSFAFAYHQDPTFGMTLLSDDGGTVRIGLQTVLTGAYSTMHHDNWSQAILFNASVADGYRVTSMRLTGVFVGVIEQTFPTNWDVGEASMHEPGFAYSHSSVDLTLHLEGHDTSLASQATSTLNGTQAILSGYGQTLYSDFDLTITSSSSASAHREEIFLTFPDGEQGWIQGTALASINAQNVVLTFQVAPVPEPATYGMLIGGLGMLGFAARRRRMQ